MEWTLAAVILIAVIFGIFMVREEVKKWYEDWDRVYCSMAEHDARSIAVEIADYFAWPQHTTLPTLNGESKYLGYTLNSRDGQNVAWVTGNAEEEIDVTIIVKDASGKCPKSYQETTHGWDSGKYTLKMQ